MTTPPIAPTRVNLTTKIFDCLFSGIGISLLILNFLNGIITPIVTTVLSIIILAGAMIFLLVWSYREKNEHFPSGKVHAWLLGIIRYCLAYIISVYGFAKILKTQFGALYSRNDIPVGSLSGFELTWNYFGYSYKLAIILAALQIGGSILLFFRRTTLLGVCVLMPVMINIVLINIFYSIATGAFIVSLLITGALTYLLVLNREPLIRIFFNDTIILPPLQLSFFKPVIRIFIIAIAYFTIYRYIMNEKPIDFSGKWKVDKIERNGQPVDENAWMTDNDAWKYIYIEAHGQMFFSPNPYFFEPGRAKHATFKYDDKTHKLGLRIIKQRKPVDSMMISITKKSKHAMEWVGTSANNSFKIQLEKVEVPVH